ncbi:hypothetical protein V2A60_003403 [Cordyceps javanica]
MPHGYTALVLDLGGVLFSTPDVNVGLSKRKLANALDSPAWHDYERGILPKSDCYEKVATAFDLDLGAWAAAIRALTEGQRANEELVSAIRQLKAVYTLKVYCLSNIPGPALEELSSIAAGWNIFDELYTSADSGCRKPDAAAFKNFLQSSKQTAGSCIFVDDHLENVIAAQTLGFRSLQFHDTPTTILSLYNLLGDPVARGVAFLKQNAQNHYCVTNDGETHKDNFSQLLILQNTQDRSLVHLEHSGSTWNYFIGEPRMVETRYFNDADTTSLAMVLLEDISEEERENAMKAILGNLSPEGLPYTWLDPLRPRLCHCVCANVYRFFHLNGRSDSLPAVYDYLCRLLRSDAFVLGSRYYENPDWFLYILSDLCARRPTDQSLQELRDLLVEKVQNRTGCNRDVLGAAMRLLSAQFLELGNAADLATLLDAQQIDGGWERTVEQ